MAQGFAYQAKAYPGIEALLDGLARHHVRLAVATSKLETSARAILEHLGLAGRFATICGDTQDAGRPTKAEVIAETLRRIGASLHRAGASPLTMMVGDRSHDVIGAREQGLPCLGVGGRSGYWVSWRRPVRRRSCRTRPPWPPSGSWPDPCGGRDAPADVRDQSVRPPSQLCQASVSADRSRSSK